MKKVLLYIVLTTLVLSSCKKDPEPQPEEIRSYCSILSLVKQNDNITWVVDGVDGSRRSGLRLQNFGGGPA